MTREEGIQRLSYDLELEAMYSLGSPAQVVMRILARWQNVLRIDDS